MAHFWGWELGSGRCGWLCQGCGCGSVDTAACWIRGGAFRAGWLYVARHHAAAAGWHCWWSGWSAVPPPWRLALPPHVQPLMVVWSAGPGLSAALLRCARGPPLAPRSCAHQAVPCHQLPCPPPTGCFPSGATPLCSTARLNAPGGAWCGRDGGNHDRVRQAHRGLAVGRVPPAALSPVFWFHSLQRAPRAKLAALLQCPSPAHKQLWHASHPSCLNPMCMQKCPLARIDCLACGCAAQPPRPPCTATMPAPWPPPTSPAEPTALWVAAVLLHSTRTAALVLLDWCVRHVCAPPSPPLRDGGLAWGSAWGHTRGGAHRQVAVWTPASTRRCSAPQGSPPTVTTIPLLSVTGASSSSEWVDEWRCGLPAGGCCSLAALMNLAHPETSIVLVLHTQSA